MRVLGIDTSCYTTSVALIDNGQIIQKRRLLSVKLGERGLRQSEALFQHVERLPDLLGALFTYSPGAVDGVCVSTRPRNVEGSYMPVFLAGVCSARSVATVQNIPMVETSHQQGHIRAAMVDSGIEKEPFIAIHLSGGTTEAVLVERGLQTTLLAMTSDIHAGQLVDRAGVAMGLSFPAGPGMEELARRGEARHVMPLSYRENQISFSGAEAQAMRMIAAGEASEKVAAEVYSYLSRVVTKLIDISVRQTGIKNVLLGGGVASSALLRELVPLRMNKKRRFSQFALGTPRIFRR